MIRDTPMTWWKRKGLEPSPNGLWLVRWSDGRRSLLTARQRRAALRLCASRRRRRSHGWPRGRGARFVSLQPVRSLSLNIASYRRGNTPQYFEIGLADEKLSWAAAAHGCLARAKVVPAERSRSNADASGSEPLLQRIWALVRPVRELTVYTAEDLSAAHDRAIAFTDVRPALGDVEPVERVELQLSPADPGFAATSYRLRIFGQWVQWPPAPRRAEAPQGPPWPMHAVVRVARPGDQRHELERRLPPVERILD